MLDITALRGMTKEEQINAAAKYIGIPAGYVSGQWKQESGQGSHPTMIGQPTKWGTAKGHFQILDGVHSNIEAKTGTKLDRFDFTESLASYAEIMKENVSRYGNADDATRAYHGGWNKKNWGAQTEDYVQKVRAYAGAVPVVGQPKGTAPVSKRNPTGISTEEWMARTGPVTPADVTVSLDDTRDKIIRAATPGVIMAPPGMAAEQDQIVRRESQVLLEKEQKQKDDQTFGQALSAAYRETMRPTFNVLAHIMTPDDGVDKQYVGKLADDPSQVLKLIENPTPEEARQLLNTHSAEDLTLTLGNINDKRENTAVLARASTGVQLTAMFMAGAADPLTYATGLGAAKAFAIGGIGAVQLARAGRPGLAVASVMAENAAGNVAYEAALQAMGEHRSVADYGMAAATGLIPGAVQAPSAWRAGVREAARRVERQALEAQIVHLERAAKALGPDAEPAEVRALASIYEAEALRTDRAGRTAAPSAGDRINAPDLDDPALKVEGEDSAMDFPKLDTSAPEPHPLQSLQDGTTDKTSPTTLEWAGEGLTDQKLRDRGLTVTADQVKVAKPGTHLDPSLKGNAWFDMQAKNVEYLRAKYLPDVAIHIGDTAKATVNDLADKDGFHTILAPGQSLVSVKAGSQGTWTAAHELGHAIFDHYMPTLPPKIAAGIRRDYLEWLKNADSIEGGQARLGFGRVDTDGAMSATLKGEGKGWSQNLIDAVGPEKAKTYERYFRSLDEFAAEQFVKQVDQDLAEQIAKGNVTAPQQMLLAFKSLVKRMLDLWNDLTAKGLTKPGEGFAEFFRAAASGELVASGTQGRGINAMALPTAGFPQHLNDVLTRYNLDRMDTSDVRGRAEQKAVAQIIYDAEKYMERNPQDLDKLKTIMGNSLFDMRTPGLILASADNPVFKMVSALIVENTMGGSGRNVTAALRKAQWEREFIGNSIVATGSHYETFRNRRLGKLKGIADDLSEAKTRKEFNDAVYMEQNARLMGRNVGSPPEVVAAADALTVSFERMRTAQVEAKTVGWGALPDNSRGYLPRIVNKRIWFTLSSERKRAIHGVFADQFEAGGMDRAFAERVASKYMDHISTNANGGHEIPVNVNDPAALDYVTTAMRAAGMTREQVQQFASRMAKGGPSHTKARLDLDVLAEYKDSTGATFRLMDIMETDPVELLRGQARRVSGEVALTQHGIMGSAGMKLLRKAAEHAQLSSDAGHIKAMEAFDQVGAEMLGRPFGDEMPTWMEGAITANAASNLGMMGWMQMGELINVATGLGVMDTLKMVSDFPRIMQEVRVLAKGGKVNNGILGSLEVSGAEFGMSGYKMVTRYDNPTSDYAAVGRQDSGLLIKGVRAMGHMLGTVSLHRIIQATQVRGVAEQITKKALRYINEGTQSKALADMGFTPEMTARIKAELPNIVKFDGQGRVMSVDMTKAGDANLIGDFVATLNRGAGQLIQDTFIGEKGAWQHSNLGKVMTQFRSFPITAMEKQWGRLRGMHGAPAAIGIIMAAAPMGFALYAARTAMNAIGRPDADAYLERQFQPVAVGRGLMNYIGALGLAPDIMDALSAVAVPDDLKKEWGLQTRAGSNPTLGGIVPVVGYADTWLKAANNPDDPHAVARALPFSNAPWAVPLLNMLRPDR